MKRYSLLSALAGAALLAGCATPWEVADVKAVQDTEATGGTAFTKALLEEYKAYAKHESTVEYEWDHAAIFARKGLHAAKGEVVLPEEVADWDVPAARVKELSDARARLVGYFANGARDRVPAAAAKAQAMFDCWIEEEAEGDALSECRAEFLKVEPELQVKAAAEKAHAKIVKTFVVYFDFNKAVLTPASRKTLSEVATAQADIKPLNIFLTGHTDTVGKTGYNQKLSEARVQAVSDALAKLGVKSTILDAKAFGKTKPAVNTGDNVKEQKNRRVEINFEK